MTLVAPELAAALQVLEHAFGPLQVLDVRPTPPERSASQPVPAAAGPAVAGPDQPSLFEATTQPPPSTTHPTRRRWRAVPRHARPLSPASPSTWRSP